MRNQDELNARRTVLSMAVGQSATLTADGSGPGAIVACVKAFARRRDLPVSIEVASGVVRVTRIEAWPVIKKSAPRSFSELDSLAPGESVLFTLAPAEHHRVRIAASQRNKAGALRLTCSREADAIRVTRLGEGQPQVRATKYGLERLETEREIRLTVDPEDRHRLRMACSQKSRLTGWVIRCRQQDDGSMRVYRAD